MKHIVYLWFLWLNVFFLPLFVTAQTAPAHLKYFGFVAIDCFYDDPLDSSTTANYIAEVDSFSNIAHMCVYDYTDNIVARTNTMNDHCVLPILHIQNVFFYYADTLAPSGANYNLYADYVSRWNTFKTVNAAVLNPTNTGCFYVADEPVWNGIPIEEMNLVSTLLKNDYPTIPQLLVEAYASLNVMEIPATIDWVGFDRYGVYDPQTDPDFLANMDTVKAKLSAPHQKLMLIIDDQWFPEYLTYLGWTQNTMADVVQNYYDYAQVDTSVLGLIGYIWPGGLDSPTQHGVRNLPAVVKNKNIEIGKQIKNNFNPCSTIGFVEAEEQYQVKVFPNPVVDVLTIELPLTTQGTSITIYTPTGEIVATKKYMRDGATHIDVTQLNNGLYFILLENDQTTAITKFVVNN